MMGAPGGYMQGAMGMGYDMGGGMPPGMAGMHGAMGPAGAALKLHLESKKKQKLLSFLDNSEATLK